MKTEAQIIISRSSGIKGDSISIRFTDERSRALIVEASISCEDFAKAITGLVLSNVPVECGKMDRVGKKLVQELREIVCPLTCYSREKLGDWLEENAKEEGWEVSRYLGSQGSVEHHPNGQLLHYTVWKWVPVE